LNSREIDRFQLLHEVTQFIYREARLQDEHKYREWESLWADDGVYWIPANGENTDPDQQMSIVFDNRSRISVRVNQLCTGKRHTQNPRSSIRRLVSNIEILAEKEDGIEITANAMVFETTRRGDTVWASRNLYRLRRKNDEFEMVLKKVVLVNNDSGLYTLSFLI
jgi:3-phenylpropionate/cinnamic acid dioxygenase small subunit